MGDLVWSHGPRYFGTVRKEIYIYMHALLLLLLLLLFMRKLNSFRLKLEYNKRNYKARSTSRYIHVG